MTTQIADVVDHIISRPVAKVGKRQTDLAGIYMKDPEEAWITDVAESSSEHITASEPYYSQMTLKSNDAIDVPLAVHKAVGGESELPTPGHLLAGAIAGCIDSSIRMIASRFGVGLTHLNVSVTLGVDVRGTLCIDQTVPVGFQDADIQITLSAEENVTEEELAIVLKMAKHCCILLQTFKAPPAVNIETQIL